MPSKPSTAKYLIAINLPHGVGPEPFPGQVHGGDYSLPGKMGITGEILLGCGSFQTPFLLAAAAAPGLGGLLEKKNSNS